MKDSETDKKTIEHTRSEVIRDTMVLQLKLIVDGLRDLLLMPLVVLATLSGLILHKKKPGRYLYRLLSYGRVSEKWIGLFDEAQKDTMPPIELDSNSLDELLKKTQNAFESKYVDEDKKQVLLHKFNLALDEINNKVNAVGKQKTS
ncbi:MAG TPA: hypothetical protein ENJ41_00150 [Oceanospirillales bacterium]|nr:hypothetical protein [Oceanospirillales bacterium]